MLLFDVLARGGSFGGRQTSGGKTQRLRVQLEQSGLWRSGIAKLEAQLDGGRQMRGRARQQQVGVADGVQRRGTAKGTADLFTADRFANVVHDDERRLGRIISALFTICLTCASLAFF